MWVCERAGRSWLAIAELWSVGRAGARVAKHVDLSVGHGWPKRDRAIATQAWFANSTTQPEPHLVPGSQQNNSSDATSNIIEKTLI